MKSCCQLLLMFFYFHVAALQIQQNYHKVGIFFPVVYCLTGCHKIKVFSHLYMSKCVQNNNVYRGNIPLWNSIANYYKCSFIFMWRHCKFGEITARLAFLPVVYSLIGCHKIKVFSHLYMFKCFQNNTVYRGDIPLCSHNKVYLVSPCVLAKSQLQSWQNYHEVSSLSKSFLVQLSLEIVSSPCLSSFYFLLSQF